MKVSVIIPTLNYKDRDTVFNLLSKQTYKDLELILVYHEGTPDSVPINISALDKLNYKIINYKGRFNWSRMNNLGANFANGDIFLFMNDDMYLKSEKVIEEIISIFHSYSEVGLIGVYKETSRVPIFYKDNLYYLPDVRGSFQAIRREDFNQLNGYSEDYIVVGSDTDICFRVWFNLNKMVVVTGSSKYSIEHQEFSTRKKLFNIPSEKEIDKKDMNTLLERWRGKYYKQNFKGKNIEFYL